MEVGLNPKYNLKRSDLMCRKEGGSWGARTMARETRMEGWSGEEREGDRVRGSERDRKGGGRERLG